MAAPLFFELFFAHRGLAASINVPGMRIGQFHKNFATN